ncbi:BatD family protein [Paludisphaera rhizosphaerae]|uniref:BatD family protein n=1 Tax=Paludisphaera rhizosphaerae TaxID=2711216 RepID=UPI0013ED3C45|nr:BatD family protein [Paludisphaera rhizosphaerae]
MNTTPAGRRPAGGVWFSPTPGHSLVLAVFAFLALAPSCLGEDLLVRVRVRSDRVLAGQGADVFVDVPAQDKRPKLEWPALKDARMWVVEETFRPTSVTAIGGAVASDNLFTTRLRLVATAPGRLDVPPITARLGDRTGRSAPIRLTIDPPPIAGRPPGFLGGVGDFKASAEVQPAQVRVGQEALYRIRVEGPGAWGMTTRPDLDRLRALAIEPRVGDLPDETVDEPPSRAFVYRIRAMQAGEVVLPPVSIASYDPRVGRYVTHVSGGVPFKVVAAPAFNPEGIDYRPPAPGMSAGRIATISTAAAMAAMILTAIVLRRRVADVLRKSFPGHRRGARRFAVEAARKLGEASEENVARETLDAIAEYARIGVGRPPGALTPREAAEAVARVSRSDEMARRAAVMAARCDHALFAAPGTAGGEKPEEAGRLQDDARELFEALGRSGGRWWE